MGIAETVLEQQPQAKKRATARHIPTDHLWRVVLEIPGVGVHLESIERREITIKWAEWLDGNIWSKQP